MSALYFADFTARAVVPLESKRNPDTGIVVVRYPLSWGGLAEYTLGEIRRSGGAVDMPEEYRAQPDRTRIQVYHDPAQIVADNFVRSCYNLPLMKYEHAADGLHMQRPGDSGKVVGMFGTNMQIRNIGGIDTPTLDAAIFDPETQAAIEAGADESSLCYTCGHDWTPGVYNGTAYQMSHILDARDPRIADLIAAGKAATPIANHSTIALRPGDSRGYRRTTVILDRREEPREERYAERMRFSVNAAAARRLPRDLLDMAKVPAGKTADGPITIEVPDDDKAAVNRVAAALAAATSEIATAAETAETGLASAQTELGAMQAAMPELQADAAFGRAERVKLEKATAVGMGVPADKLTAADSADAVREITVRHLVPGLTLPTTADAAAVAGRKHMVSVAWTTLDAAHKARQADAAAAAAAATVKPPGAAAAKEAPGTRPLAADTNVRETDSVNGDTSDANARAFLGLPPTGK